MKRSKGNMILGFFLGIITCCIFAIGFYFLKIYPTVAFAELPSHMVLLSPMLQVGVVCNIIWIYLFSKWDRPYWLRGVGFAIIALVLFVIYLKANY